VGRAGPTSAFAIRAPSRLALLICDELRSHNEAGVDDRIRAATRATQSAMRRSAAVVNSPRVPSWARSSLASLVASIDERLAALRGEIDPLQQGRAALASNTALAHGAADRRAQATRAPRAAVAGAAVHRSNAAPGSRPQTRAARPTVRRPNALVGPDSASQR
jgi:hypothetical protein